MSYQISYYDKANPQLVITLKSGRRIEFSVAGMQAETAEWLGHLLEDRFEKETELAAEKAVLTLQAQLRKLLGVQ